MTARETLTPVELNVGDICRFTLANGETRTIELLGGTSAVLDIPTTEGLVATFTMRLRVDGFEIDFRRYLATQESFYEPAVVNGLRIFPDSTLEYLVNTVPMRYPSSGPMRHHPWKDARIVIQDASLTLCPEELHPWFLDRRIDDLFIPVGDCYHGGDCWLGPFSFGEAHGGLDIRMKKGDYLYAPFSCDEQFMPLWANKNRGATSRWRGIRRWPDGTVWSINTSHVIDSLVPEHTPLLKGQAYCTAAGTAVGEFEHTHFELHVHRDLNPPDVDWDKGFGASPDVKNDCPRGQPEFYNIDPWVLFWQTFVQIRAQRGGPIAEIAPFGPARTGTPTTFRTAAPVPQGMTAVWTFNDGTMHVGEEVCHTFARPGAYRVTLILTDFAEKRVRDSAVITVAGEAPMGSLPGVRSGNVSFVELKPRDLPAWGEKITIDPFTVADESELEFYSRSGGATVAPRLIASRIAAPGIEWRQYAAGEGETAEVFIRQDNAGRRRLLQERTSVSLIGESSDSFRTPCFWVQHQYHGRRRHYVVNGGRAEEGQFIRCMPALRAGRWRISMSYDAPHQPGASYWIAVSARDGIHRVRFEPLRCIEVGTFDFDEGNGGYVQIEASDSVGQIAASSLVFEPVALGALSWLPPEEELALKTEKGAIETALTASFEEVRKNPATFCADDWAAATKAIPHLVGYADGEKFFRAITAVAGNLQVINGSKEAWQSVNEWLVSRCWHGESYDCWLRLLEEREFAPSVRTEVGLKTEALGRRLLEIHETLGLL